MEENHSLFELDIDSITSEELLDTARWQKMFGLLLITIIGLVLLAFIVAWDKIRSLINESIDGESSQATMAVLIGVLLVIAGILGTMSWFLVRGAARIKSALRTKEQLVFNNGLSDLKMFFIIYGVLGILGLLGNLISLF